MKNLYKIFVDEKMKDNVKYYNLKIEIVHPCI